MYFAFEVGYCAGRLETFLPNKAGGFNTFLNGAGVLGIYWRTKLGFAKWPRFQVNIDIIERRVRDVRTVLLNLDRTGMERASLDSLLLIAM